MQGQGASTEFKERGIAAALSVSLRLAQKHPHFTYWHADLNSGSGFNDRARCIGSPIAFLESARAIGRENFRALFCDHNEAAVAALAQRIGPDRRCYCLPWDNAQVLPVLTELIDDTERNPKFAWGSILVDPNGYFGDAIPHEALIEFAQRFPRMDLVLNLNVRTYRMGRAWVDKKRGAWASKFWPAPRQFPETFERKHWLIRNVSTTGGDPFVLMVGRNFPAGDHAALGMHHLNSPTGQSILDDIDGKAAARAGDLAPLPDLFGVPATSDVPRDPQGGAAQGSLAL